MDIIPRLTAILQEFEQLQLALLFGSQATGRAGPESDIDLAVLAEAPLSPDLKMAIIARVGEAFDRPVDLIDLRVAGLPIIGQALQGHRLFGSDTCFAQVLSRYLIDAADFLPIRDRILRERRQAWIHS